jgi:hypothetical protein
MNVFAPYNAQATVHLKEAFWSMLLPMTVNGRVSDIWRSYITQSLLYLIPDSCLIFTSPAVYHARNKHSYESDFLQELQLYVFGESFIKTIRNLPMKVSTFDEAFLNIYTILYETGASLLN